MCTRLKKRNRATIVSVAGVTFSVSTAIVFAKSKEDGAVRLIQQLQKTISVRESSKYQLTLQSKVTLSCSLCISGFKDPVDTFHIFVRPFTARTVFAVTVVVSSVDVGIPLCPLGTHKQSSLVISLSTSMYTRNDLTKYDIKVRCVRSSLVSRRNLLHPRDQTFKQLFSVHI